MECFAKRTIPECRYATRNFSGQEGWRVLELGLFDKHFVKNVRIKGPAGKHFGNIFPRYSQNYILNGKFNPKMNTMRAFLSKMTTLFLI